MTTIRAHALTIVLAIVVFLPTVSSAQTLRVVDQYDTVTVLTNPTVIYSSGGVLVSSTRVQGIRVARGSGTVTIDWNRIKEITYLDPATDLKVQVLLTNGETSAVRLEQGTLAGNTSLGEFRLSLYQVKKITVLPTTRK